MNQLLSRIFGNPKTTIGGLIGGGVFAAAGAMIIAQAGCQFENVQWWEVIGILFAGPAVTGAAATDNGQTA